LLLPPPIPRNQKQVEAEEKAKAKDKVKDKGKGKGKDNEEEEEVSKEEEEATNLLPTTANTANIRPSVVQPQSRRRRPRWTRQHLCRRSRGLRPRPRLQRP
jgi:hypothetical protein